MEIEWLRGLFPKNADGSFKPMSPEELEAAIEGKKELKVVNLSDGGYVSQQKYDRVSEESKTYKGQLDEAMKTVQTYKDMDIDGIKSSAAALQTKYDTDTAELNRRLTQQAYDFGVKEFLNGYQFSDDMAREGVEARFKKQEFKRDDSTGKFLGAEDWMKQLQTSNPGAFKAAEPDPQPAPPLPTFTNPNGGGTPAPANSNPFASAFNFNQVR